jgi:hypothetical protein
MKIYNELESLGFFEWLSETHDLADTDMKAEYLDKLPLNDIHRTVCNSMAFRWFREKYKIFSSIMTEYSYGGTISAYHINGLHQSDISKGDFYTYEEAELACLIKLIEIVKEK